MRKELTYHQNYLINTLKEYAKNRGLKVVFRNRKMPSGDFCFFVYHPDRRSYLIGFDGSWDVDENNICSFTSCLKETRSFIEKYL